MVGKVTTRVEDVRKILNTAQNSITAHRKCAELLWDVERRNSVACFEELRLCLEHVLLVSHVRCLDAHCDE